MRKPRFHIPQHEFGFTANTFNLFAETGIDGDRIAREREQAEQARRETNAAQARFFPQTSNQKSRP